MPDNLGWPCVVIQLRILLALSISCKMTNLNLSQTHIQTYLQLQLEIKMSIQAPRLSTQAEFNAICKFKSDLGIQQQDSASGRVLT